MMRGRFLPHPPPPLIPVKVEQKLCAKCGDVLYGVHVTCAKCGAAYHSQCGRRSAQTTHKQVRNELPQNDAYAANPHNQ